MSSGGEPAHIDTDLGEDDVCPGNPDPGDLIEFLHRQGERGDHLLDLVFECGDVGVQRVDPGEHRGQQEPVVVGEMPGERLLQRPAPKDSTTTSD